MNATFDWLYQATSGLRKSRLAFWLSGAVVMARIMRCLRYFQQLLLLKAACCLSNAHYWLSLSKNPFIYWFKKNILTARPTVATA